MAHIWIMLMLKICKHTQYAIYVFYPEGFATKILLSGKFSLFLTLGNSGWQHLRVWDLIFQLIEREKTHLCQRVFLLCSFGIIRHPFKFLVDQVPQSLRRDQLQLLHFPEEHGYISSIIFRGAKKENIIFIFRCASIS